jgi:hypothetical protein
VALELPRVELLIGALPSIKSSYWSADAPLMSGNFEDALNERILSSSAPSFSSLVIGMLYLARSGTLAVGNFTSWSPYGVITLLPLCSSPSAAPRFSPGITGAPPILPS